MGMNLQKRIGSLVQLREYLLSDTEEWKEAKQKAYIHNKWFIPEFIDLAVKNIADKFLSEPNLRSLAERYSISGENEKKQVGIVPAGNIPMVGFHDILCTYLAGHHAVIKPSSKDEVLIKHLIDKLKEIDKGNEAYFSYRDLLNGCDGYIATGSTNTSRYFEHYFGKYPHIIRRNRTSVAILTGKESPEELRKLADDVMQYFGLGCRNVTKLYVPEGYDFIPLLNAFDKYKHLADLNMYKNNYDYNLSLHILNKKYYMTNDVIVLVEDPAIFSPISQLHYEYYSDKEKLKRDIENNTSIQCVVGENGVGFGEAQCPEIDTYADGVDTMEFLVQLGANN